MALVKYGSLVPESFEEFIGKITGSGSGNTITLKDIQDSLVVEERSAIEDYTTGNRVDLFTITSDFNDYNYKFDMGNGYNVAKLSSIVNGNFAGNVQNSWAFGDTIECTGKAITFTLKSPAKLTSARMILDRNFYRSRNPRFKWQASVDGSYWKDISSVFSLNNSPRVNFTLETKCVAYRLLGVDGIVDTGPWVTEVEFEQELFSRRALSLDEATYVLARVLDPQVETDAANKRYVDKEVEGSKYVLKGLPSFDTTSTTLDELRGTHKLPYEVVASNMANGNNGIYRFEDAQISLDGKFEGSSSVGDEDIVLVDLYANIPTLDPLVLNSAVLAGSDIYSSQSGIAAKAYGPFTKMTALGISDAGDGIYYAIQGDYLLAATELEGDDIELKGVLVRPLLRENKIDLKIIANVTKQIGLAKDNPAAPATLEDAVNSLTVYEDDRYVIKSLDYTYKPVGDFYTYTVDQNRDSGFDLGLYWSESDETFYRSKNGVINKYDISDLTVVNDSTLSQERTNRSPSEKAVKAYIDSHTVGETSTLQSSITKVRDDLTTTINNTRNTLDSKIIDTGYQASRNLAAARTAISSDITSARQYTDSEINRINSLVAGNLTALNTELSAKISTNTNNITDNANEIAALETRFENLKNSVGNSAINNVEKWDESTSIDASLYNEGDTVLFNKLSADNGIYKIESGVATLVDALKDGDLYWVSSTDKLLVNDNGVLTAVTRETVIASATSTDKGVVELATTTETVTGTDNSRAVTPEGVKAAIDAIPPAPNASESERGHVQLASLAEVEEGTDITKAVTPAGVSSLSHIERKHIYLSDEGHAKYNTGDRTGFITVTSNAVDYGSSVTQNLVNGKYGRNSNESWAFGLYGQSRGIYLLFELQDEVRLQSINLKQDRNEGSITFKTQYSEDGSTWLDGTDTSVRLSGLDNVFNFDAPKGYKFYRLMSTNQTVSSGGPWITEAEFNVHSESGKVAETFYRAKEKRPIRNIAEPSNYDDVATKGYVDQHTQDATEDTKGQIQLANEDTAIMGIDNTQAMTPKNVRLAIERTSAVVPWKPFGYYADKSLVSHEGIIYKTAKAFTSSDTFKKTGVDYAEGTPGTWTNDNMYHESITFTKDGFTSTTVTARVASVFNDNYPFNPGSTSNGPHGGNHAFKGSQLTNNIATLSTGTAGATVEWQSIRFTTKRSTDVLEEWTSCRVSIFEEGVDTTVTTDTTGEAVWISEVISSSDGVYNIKIPAGIYGKTMKVEAVSATNNSGFQGVTLGIKIPSTTTLVLLEDTNLVKPEDITSAVNAIPSASISEEGLVELATVVEAKDGVNSQKAVTPQGLKAAIDAIPPVVTPEADSTTKGIVELATEDEARIGLNTTKAVTPAGVRQAIASTAVPQVPTASTTVEGKVLLATEEESIAGTNDTKAVTPAGVNSMISAKSSIFVSSSDLSSTEVVGAADGAIVRHYETVDDYYMLYENNITDMNDPTLVAGSVWGNTVYSSSKANIYDNDDDTGWSTTPNPYDSGDQNYLGRYYANAPASVLKRVIISHTYPNNNAGRNIGMFMIQGTNDGVNWTDVERLVNVSNDTDSSSVDISNTTAYKGYRLFILANRGSDGDSTYRTMVNEIRFYGNRPKENMLGLYIKVPNDLVKIY